LILLCVAAVRLIYAVVADRVALCHGSDPYLGVASDDDSTARNIVEGTGFSTSPQAPRAYRSPLPAVSGLFVFFGVGVLAVLRLASRTVRVRSMVEAVVGAEVLVEAAG
jgi:hypothetical protein